MVNSNSTKSRIIDRWVDVSKIFGPVTIVAAVILVWKLFEKEGICFNQFAQKHFDTLLIVAAYLIYILRVYWSLNALTRKKVFWGKIDEKFEIWEVVLDDILKLLATVIILISHICVGFTNFESVAEYFDYYFLVLIILGVGWELIINHRLKILTTEKEKNVIEQTGITKALSSWVVLDFLLFFSLGFFMVFSKVPSLEKYPIIQADGFFWIHFLFTVQDFYKNKEFYWGSD